MLAVVAGSESNARSLHMVLYTFYLSTCASDYVLAGRRALTLFRALRYQNVIKLLSTPHVFLEKTNNM